MNNDNINYNDPDLFINLLRNQNIVQQSVEEAIQTINEAISKFQKATKIAGLESTQEIQKIIQEAIQKNGKAKDFIQKQELKTAQKMAEEAIQIAKKAIQETEKIIQKVSKDTVQNSHKKYPPKNNIIKFRNNNISPKKSIGNHKKTSHKKIKQLDLANISEKILIGTTIVGVLTTAAFLITMNNDTTLSPKNDEPINQPSYVDENYFKDTAIEMFLQKIKLQKLEELRINNLIDINIKKNLTGKVKYVIEFKNNSIEDYTKLNINSSIDLYVFEQILPNEEFIKLKQAHQNIEMQDNDSVREQIFEIGPYIIAEYENNETNTEANYINSDINPELSNRNDTIKFFIEVFQKQKLYDLLNNGLAKIEINEKGECYIKINNNAINDYKKLKLSKQLDIYIYYLILPRDELEKLIQASTFINEFNNEHYYTGLRQFLSINGYFRPNTTNPSDKVFENYMEEKLFKNAEYYLEIIENNNSKPQGGKQL